MKPKHLKLIERCNLQLSRIDYIYLFIGVGLALTGFLIALAAVIDVLGVVKHHGR